MKQKDWRIFQVFRVDQKKSQKKKKLSPSVCVGCIKMFPFFSIIMYFIFFSFFNKILIYLTFFVCLFVLNNFADLVEEDFFLFFVFEFKPGVFFFGCYFPKPIKKICIPTLCFLNCILKQSSMWRKKEKNDSKKWKWARNFHFRSLFHFHLFC